MAVFGMGVFYTGVIVGIPVVTGVAEGVSHQKKMNEEAADNERMVKFYLDVFCEANGEKSKEVAGGIIVLKHGKVWIVPQDPKTQLPTPEAPGDNPHPFTGFYIMYPDDDRSPPERGLVSTISVDPPMLNWIYCDKDSHELRYGNRTASIQHVVGPWDWTDDDEHTGVMLEGWEGFVAVEEKAQEDGLKWAVYFDRWDDGLNAGKKVGGKNRLQISLERRCLPEELRKAQEEAAERKMRVKQSGDLKTQLNLRGQ